MKKAKGLLAFLLCTAMLLGVLPAAQAYSETDVAYRVEGGNIYFDMVNGMITDCDDTVTSADIPAEISGVAVMIIGSEAFADHGNLKKVTIPGSVESIEDYAFSGSGLSSLTLENGVLNISLGAFRGCESLTSVVIPRSVEAIAPMAFSNCVSLTDLSVDAENPYYFADESGVLFNKDATELIAFPASYIGEYAVSENVTSICDWAFDCCVGLTHVTIPESVEYIGECAFDGCEALQSVTIFNPECDVYFDEGTLGPADQTVIYGRKDSTAQSYAESYGYSFAAIMCKAHILEYFEAREVDCTQDGCIEHWYCGECGRYFSDEAATQEIPSDQVYTEREAHVFSEDGKCENCGCGQPFVIHMVDSCGDGWSYNAIAVFEDGEPIRDLTVDKGEEATVNIDYYDDREYYFVWQEGSWPEECSFAIMQGEETLYACDNASTLEDGGTFFAICEHIWLEGNCEVATVCEKCNMKDGEAPGHDYDAVVKEETCTEEGYTTYTCKVCGDSYIDDYQLPGDHNYVPVITAPTCTEYGYTTYTCSECGDSYIEDKVLPSHNLVDDVCTVCGAVSPILIEMRDSWGDGWNGNTILVYENGELIEELTFESGSEATASINYNADSEYYFVWKTSVSTNECSFSIIHRGETLFEAEDTTVFADGQTVFAICEHNWIEASCEAPKTCNKCNTTEGEAAGHEYNEVDLCIVCGEYVPFVIHMTDIWGNGWNGNALLAYENGELVKELTFDAGEKSTQTVDYHEGSEYYFVWQEGLNADQCAFTIMRKDVTLFETADASTFVDGQTVFAICEHAWSEATCVDPKTCEKCYMIEGEALGHSYNEEEVCTVCGCLIPIVVEMSDSCEDGWNGNKIIVYEDDLVIAELTIEDGANATAIIERNIGCEYRFEWCAGDCMEECSFRILKEEAVLYECGDAGVLFDEGTFFTIDAVSENADPIPDPNLKFNMDIAVGAEMVVNYNFMASIVSKYEDFYLEVSKDVVGGDPIVTTYGISEAHNPVVAINNPVTGAAIMYNAAYTGINAKEMGDSFATTLCAIDAEGKVYKGETVVRSIKDYLLGKLEDTNSIPELKTMAVDMLKYGAAAQVNFNYDTENLVTADLTEEQLALATQEIPAATDHASVTGAGANVNTNITVNSKVELSLSCISAGQADPAAVKCIVTDKDGKVLAEIATANIGGVMYSAKYDNVGAKEMREVITATFVNGNGDAISKTVNWSVESYVAQTRARTDATETEIAMVNAMLTYGDSVAAYMTAQETK